MSDNAIHIEGLRKRFWRNAVLQDLDLDVGHGETVVVLGRNGAGKSTLFRLLLGTLAPDAGSLGVLGLDPLRCGARLRRRVGYVPSTPDAYRWMSFRDLCRFLEPYYPGWSRERAGDLAAQLEVPLRTPFRKMSRGEGMKAMLCAALAPEPELLLLDEPFAGLDPIVREEVLRGVIGHLKDTQRTVVCTTHDLDVAARIADRVVYLENGRVQKDEYVDEVQPEALRAQFAGISGEQR